MTPDWGRGRQGPREVFGGSGSSLGPALTLQRRSGVGGALAKGPTLTPWEFLQSPPLTVDQSSSLVVTWIFMSLMIKW